MVAFTYYPPWKAEIGGIMVQGHPWEKNVSKAPLNQ
jgi:hypothetical protein